MEAEERSEWERLMGEDGPPDDWDEPQTRYESGDDWDQRLREEGAVDNGADGWGWCAPAADCICPDSPCTCLNVS